MVTRKQSQSGGKASQQLETHGESSVIDEFVIKLAQALQRRGKRAWKVNFVHACNVSIHKQVNIMRLKSL